jgi:hypothetical protein
MDVLSLQYCLTLGFYPQTPTGDACGVATALMLSIDHINKKQTAGNDQHSLPLR